VQSDAASCGTNNPASNVVCNPPDDGRRNGARNSLDSSTNSGPDSPADCVRDCPPDEGPDDPPDCSPNSPGDYPGDGGVRNEALCPTLDASSRYARKPPPASFHSVVVFRDRRVVRSVRDGQPRAVSYWLMLPARGCAGRGRRAPGPRQCGRTARRPWLDRRGPLPQVDGPSRRPSRVSPNPGGAIRWSSERAGVNSVEKYGRCM
jgi:hypothetical protein